MFFFPEKWCICSCLLSSLQTEEDYIPYPSVHEVLLDHLCHLYFNYLQWLLCVYTFTFQWRCWVALLRFHSSFCPSSVATGLRGPIISLQSRQKLTSHLVLPPISNWRQTAQLKYTGSISWGRWEEMQNNLVQMPKKNKKTSQTFGCSAERALLPQKLQMSSVLVNTNELEFIQFLLDILFF